MKTTSPEFLETLKQAARLRAEGLSWECVGRTLGRDPDTCRLWPAAHVELWQTLFQAAQKDVAIEADAEARFILRQILRSAEPKIQLSAAAKLILPKRRAGADDPDSDAAAEVAAYLAELRELCHDDLEQLICRFLEARRRVAAVGQQPGAPVTE